MTEPLARLRRDQQLRPFGPRLHVATGTAHFLGVPTFNTVAVAELERPGELLVWNPIALTDPLRRSLDELCARTGRRPTVLLGTMDYHHRAIGDWQRAYPEAETFLVSERIREHAPEVRGRVLDEDRPVIPGCEADVELLSARGFLQPWSELSRRSEPRREWEVLHRPSRTLLVGDLLFVNDRASWAERTFLGFRVGFSRNRAGFRTGDARGVEGFVRELLAWDVEQALTVHGRATAHGGDYVRGEIAAAFGR